MTDDFSLPTSGSKSSQLDTEVDDSSDIATAGSDDEVEPDLEYAQLPRSTEGGIRDESTRHFSASAVKRSLHAWDLLTPRLSDSDKGEQDNSDVYRNSAEDVAGDLIFRRRSVRKHPVVSYHRPATDNSGVLDTSTSLSLTTGGRQHSINCTDLWIHTRHFIGEWESESSRTDVTVLCC